MKIKDIITETYDYDEYDPLYLYFAYGSNMSPAQMNQRLGGYAYFSKVGPALLHDYQLTMERNRPNATNGVANIRPVEGGIVKGYVWEIDSVGIEILDDYEGYYGDNDPSTVYSKKVMEVSLGDTIVDAIVYLMLPQHGSRQPTGAYRGRIAKGYNHSGYPVDRLDRAISRSIKRK
jgi:hypothetical protein